MVLVFRLGMVAWLVVKCTCWDCGCGNPPGVLLLLLTVAFYFSHSSPIPLPPGRQARELVPLRTKLGGLSTLQAAICYDTLGAAKEAQALYKK